MRIIQLLADLRKGSAEAEKTLQRHLFKLIKRHFVSFELNSTELEENFIDSFIAFQTKVMKGRITLSKNERRHLDELNTRFIRIFRRLLFDMKKNVVTVIKGVKMNDTIAISELAQNLTNDKNLNHANKLAMRFRGLSKDAEGIVNEFILELVKLIQTGEYTLGDTVDNTHSKNKINAFFREFMFRKLYAEHRKLKLQSDDEILKELPDEKMTDANVMQLSYLEKVVELLGELEGNDQLILNEYFTKGTKPAQIAKLLPTEKWSSDQVKKKLKELIKWLDKRIMEAIQQGEIREITHIINTYGAVLAAMPEPCQTILKNALPPKSLKNEAIVDILQQNRPAQEVENLDTEEKVRKRKSKCMDALREKVWSSIINRKA